MLQQPALAIEPSTVSPEGAIGGDDAVAGNHDRNRVAAIGGADRARGPRPPDPAGELGIATGRAKGYALQFLPHQALKGCAFHPQA